MSKKKPKKVDTIETVTLPTPPKGPKPDLIVADAEHEKDKDGVYLVSILEYDRLKKAGFDMSVVKIDQEGEDLILRGVLPDPREAE